MDAARWQRIQDLFSAASLLPLEEQEPFLRHECADDRELLSKLLSMLDTDRNGSLLDRHIESVAQDVVTNSEAAPPARIGPYTLKDRIGQGGMGVVYLAERDNWQSLVAIKLPRDAWISSDRMQRFADEQRLLSQLTHPAIARIYDAGTLVDSTPWFAMEYVKGQPITDFCQARHCSIRQRLHLFRLTCEAVQYAHRRLIVHRDLKPSNILVTEAGDVKLLDFGIAKQIEESRDSGNHTRTGQRIMTTAYAAPEQVLLQPVGTQADIYSLGVVLYELLTGLLPFDMSSLSPAQIEELIKTRDPEKPSSLIRRQLVHRQTANTPPFSPGQELGKNDWADLDVLILTAMHKDPDKRYATVDALERDIARFLEGEPLDAQPDTLPYRARKFLERRRVPITASLAVLFLIIFLVSFFTYRLTKSRDLALAEGARRRRVLDFMTNMFGAWDQDLGPAKDLRVVDLLNTAITKVDKLQDDPLQQGDLYNALGSIFQELGQLHKADSLLEAALRQRTASSGANSLPVAETLMALGVLRAGDARYDEAEKLVRRSLRICQQELPKDDPIIARHETALGNVLMSKGDDRSAIRVLEDAVRVQSSRPDLLENLGESLNLLASAHFDLGNYSQSEAFTRRALAIDDRLHGENSPDAVEDVVNLASVEYRQGNYLGSEQDYRKAVADYEKWYPKGHPEIADAKRLLAQTLLAENKLDEAALLGQQALVDVLRAYGPNHPRVAYAFGVLGRAALLRGSLAEAEADYTRDLAILRPLHKGEGIGAALCGLGAAYLKETQYKRAEQSYTEAITTLNDSSPGNTHLLSANLGLGESLLFQNRYREAQPHLSLAYQGLSKQPALDPPGLKQATIDLAKLYEALNQPATAKIYQTALAR